MGTRIWPIFISLFLNMVKADIYTSLGQMTKLVETEIHVTGILKSFIDYQTLKLDEAKE